MPGYCGQALWDPKTEGFICVNGCLPANRKDKHLWTSETHEIIITDNVLALGSQHTQYSQLVIAVCFLIYCFISEPDFEAVHSAIIPAKWLPEVSEAPDYTHQFQESNSNSFFIRELRIWQLPFHFQSRNCACESLSLNISLYVRYIYGRNPPPKNNKNHQISLLFSSLCTFTRQCWNRNIVAERQNGQAL